jgi:hypothetical protein
VSKPAAPRFAPGDRVRVRELARSGHVRTPRYVRGARGVVERLCGAFRNPEELAYGVRDGGAVPLYRVRFRLAELFPQGEGVAARDTIDVELYEHWLAPEAAP